MAAGRGARCRRGLGRCHSAAAEIKVGGMPGVRFAVLGRKLGWSLRTSHEAQALRVRTTNYGQAGRRRKAVRFPTSRVPASVKVAVLKAGPLSDS